MIIMKCVFYTVWTLFMYEYKYNVSNSRDWCDSWHVFVYEKYVFDISHIPPPSPVNTILFAMHDMTYVQERYFVILFGFKIYSFDDILFMWFFTRFKIKKYILYTEIYFVLWQVYNNHMFYIICVQELRVW